MEPVLPNTVIVPAGKIVDFIDFKLRSETPEEYVRQEIEKSIVREYQFPREDIKVEYRIKVASKNARVDIALFPEGVAHKQETITTIIECKSSDIPPTHKKEGVEQLKSYMAACVNAELGMWTNGQERFCFQKAKGASGYVFHEITDIPEKGKTLDEAEKPSFASLRAATSDALLFTFRRCHNYIAGNQGLQKPEAFWEFLKLIFCKIEDERGNDIQFFATTNERQSLNGRLKVKQRLDKLFAAVKNQYPSIFKKNDVIDLKDTVLAFIVSQLQGYSLLDSEVDVKGKAYEEIVGSNLRGDRGEFFTPRNICTMAVRMIDPDTDTLVLDPSCGTGGFLIAAMNHVLAKIRAVESKKWKKPASPTEKELQALFKRVRQYAEESIVGIDLNPNLVKATKMNMVMNNDGSGGLYQANSLAKPVTWTEEDLRDRKLLGSADAVFTNPPFGSKIPVDDPAILEQFELGHVWDPDKETGKFRIREPRTLHKSQPPEILFIERCVQFLKPGTGIVAIVLPDAILGAPGLGYVREWILQNTQVVASIDLHPDAFQPKNSTQTSLLILRRKTVQEIALETAAGHLNDYKMFMALANHVGHDKRGNKTYVRDENGNEVVQTRTETVVEVHEGKEVEREVVVSYKVVDDNTEQIAATFRKWLKDQS